MGETALRAISASSALLYLSAFLLMTVKTGRKKALFADVCRYIAIALGLSLVINNFIVNGYVPFVSMYQVLTFLSVTFAIAYLYTALVYKATALKPLYTALPAVVMIGVTFMDQNSQWSFPPALNSVYFVPHVLFYMIAYSLTAAASVICIISLVKRDSVLEGHTYVTVITAFPFMVSGMLLGALWANECWGEYWQWDAKENWSLLTVLSLCVYLHFRRHEKLKRYAPYFVVLATVLLIITLFFVGMFGGESNHTYS